jgi:hypothetical protein
MNMAKAQSAGPKGAAAAHVALVSPLGSTTQAITSDIGRFVMALDATRAAATMLIDKIQTADFTPAAKVEMTRQVRLSVSEQEGLVLQGLVDASPVTLLTDSRAELEAKAVQAVLNGTTWLTAQRVGERQNPDATNQHAVTSRWKREGKIFSIERAGQTLYPKYAFDELGNPIPEVAQILEIFKGYRPFRIASWFESTNSMLRGKRPREVLATNPQAVIEAAKDHVVGAVHG